MPIPAFREDGYLPDGLHEATEGEVAERFGQHTPRRAYLLGRVREWLRLARAVGARRLMINGSFATEKAEPDDVDAVVWLPDDWSEQLRTGRHAAIELFEMLSTGQPKELFSVRNSRQWDVWVGFFSSIRNMSERKGVVEVCL